MLAKLKMRIEISNIIDAFSYCGPLRYIPSGSPLIVFLVKNTIYKLKKYSIMLLSISIKLSFSLSNGMILIKYTSITKAETSRLQTCSKGPIQFIPSSRLIRIKTMKSFLMLHTALKNRGFSPLLCLRSSNTIWPTFSRFRFCYNKILNRGASSTVT